MLASYYFLSHIMKQPQWEKYMYMYYWIIFLYICDCHNIANQLHSNIK